MAINPVGQPVPALSVSLLPSALPAVASSPSMSTDGLQLGARPLLPFAPFFAPGQKLKIIKGNYKGHSFGGEALVKAWDGQQLELEVRASKWKIIKVDVRLRFSRGADGQLYFSGQRLDGEDDPKKNDGKPRKLNDKRLTVVNQGPDFADFQASNGTPVSLVAGRGTLQVKYADDKGNPYEIAFAAKR